MIDSSQKDFFKKASEKILSTGLRVASYDFNRPWGGFFVIDENQSQIFSNIYFDGLDISTLKISGKLSPKVLVVKPNCRLSWQYHHRRSETWRILEGPVGIIQSLTDKEGDLKEYNKGDTIELKNEERHRLIGLDNWALVAEFWQHTHAKNPSNELDIIRVQDDFGR
ncbi:MAG: Uncharacterised protein [Owenweeksia sp. TMED14]|nr:MAG: Uncharacterised protein [Owenweeksia sp. TMED14]|tara:strand:- start:205 stop:705 length:501 start_codon:yes stop_codon:yes gene_type:complete